MKRYFLPVVLCIFLFGCNQPYKADFVEVVQDHKTITVETLTAVKKTIIDEATAAPNLTADQKKGVDDLLQRLDFIMDGSVTIDKYVNSNYLDEQTLAELLRSKWNKGKNNGSQ